MGSQNSSPSRDQFFSSTKHENEINFLNSEVSIKSTDENPNKKNFDEMQTDNHPKSFSIYLN